MPDRDQVPDQEDVILHYTAMALTRHGDLRQDPDWLRAQLASDRSRVLPLRADRNLFHADRQPPEATRIPIMDAALMLANAREVIYLGHEAGRALFAADLDDIDELRAEELVDRAAPGSRFLDLRRIGTLLSPAEGSLAAYARAMTAWHRNNGFCARCGQPTTAMRGGHMRHCAGCGREHFPRIDPAVIMLVELADPPDGIPRCLLGRHPGLPGRIYSTLAGYVDPGETLEQAVAREVREEAGIGVTDIRYVASQPWPFPGSLMLGFRAISHDQEPDFAADELEDARWFTADEIRAFGEFGDDRGANHELPRGDSIARLLIAQWLSEQD